MKGCCLCLGMCQQCQFPRSEVETPRANPGPRSSASLQSEVAWQISRQWEPLTEAQRPGLAAFQCWWALAQPCTVRTVVAAPWVSEAVLRPEPEPSVSSPSEPSVEDSAGWARHPVTHWHAVTHWRLASSVECRRHSPVTHWPMCHAQVIRPPGDRECSDQCSDQAPPVSLGAGVVWPVWPPTTVLCPAQPAASVQSVYCVTPACNQYCVAQSSPKHGWQKRPVQSQAWVAKAKLSVLSVTLGSTSLTWLFTFH